MSRARAVHDEIMAALETAKQAPRSGRPQVDVAEAMPAIIAGVRAADARADEVYAGNPETLVERITDEQVAAWDASDEIALVGRPSSAFEKIAEGLNEVRLIVEGKLIAARVHPSAEAVAYAERLAVSLQQKHYPEVTGWQPMSGDLYGLLTQIDNITTGLTRAPAVDAVAIRRAALEEAARFVETHRAAHINNPPFHVVHANSGAMPEPDASQKALAAAIRALAEREQTP